jgi:hypothetical protein
MFEEPDRPNRCQGITSNGQCSQNAQPGGNFCYAHNGGHDRVAEQDQRMYQLLKAKDRSRLAALSEHNDVKSLRDEIAIARMLIEERFNLIQNDSDMLTACGALNSLLLTVERLVSSAHKLEQNLGSLLAKPTLLALGNELVSIVIDELHGIPNYEEVVDRISERVITAMAKAGSNPK